MFHPSIAAVSARARVSLAVGCLIASLVSTQTVTAQHVRLLGGGCTVPGGGTPGRPDTGNESPSLGNVDFQLTFTCPIGSNTMFVLIGRCLEGPSFPDFATAPCGVNCGQRIDASGIVLEGRELLGKVKQGEFAMPVPRIAALAGTALCVQFLCFQIDEDRSRCREISQTVAIEFH